MKATGLPSLAAAVACVSVSLLAAGARAQDVSSLRINEILADNKGTSPPYIDSSGKTTFQPMIEIYNPTDQLLSIRNLLLSNQVIKDVDGKYHPVNAWKIPTATIQGNGFILVFCDGLDLSAKGQIHTKFTLATEPGLVALFKSDETLIDMVVYPRMPTDFSYGRTPDGSDTFCFFDVPTFQDCPVTSGGCLTGQNKPCSQVPPEANFQSHDSISIAADASPAENVPVPLVIRAWDSKENGVTKASILYRVNAGAETEAPMALDAAATAALTYLDPLDSTGLATVPDKFHSVWKGQIPGQPAGSVVTFAFKAENADALSGTDPTNPCSDPPAVGCKDPFRYTAGFSYQGPLVLNEVCPDNATLAIDPSTQKDEDYIELDASADMDLSGIYISSNPFHPKADWVFPKGSSILKDQHLILWFDKKEKKTDPTTGQYHLPFKLSKDGDAFFIFDTDANGLTYIDGLKFGVTPTDKAWSRVPDGLRASPMVLEAGSPGIANPVPSIVFIRGDVQNTGKLELTGAVIILQYLFLGTTAPPCLESADADDSAKIELSDAIYMLEFLFLGGAAPPLPFPTAGVDPTPDDIGCLQGYIGA